MQHDMIILCENHVFFMVVVGDELRGMVDDRLAYMFMDGAGSEKLRVLEIIFASHNSMHRV